MDVPLTSVDIGEDEIDGVVRVLRSGHLAQGPVVEEFERRFAEAHGADHAVAVSNGTTALVAALEALGVGPGAEVITSPFTFAATLNAILEVGATVRFADISPGYNLDPDAVESLISPRTSVIMPVHLYGLPADMISLGKIAERYGLAIVEDAAQAHGARIGSRCVGTWGVGCFSLYATKNLTSGEGGIVTTNDPEVADRLRLLRNQGMRARYQYEIPGHNYRMTDLQAAIAIPQLGRLESIIQRRNENAQMLSAGLGDLPGIRCPQIPTGSTHVFHQYTVAVSADSPVGRDALAEHLSAEGVGTGVYYPRLVHDYPCYGANELVKSEDTPEAKAATRTVLSLPVQQRLTGSQLERVIESIRKFVK